jgi:DNA ligase-1
MQNNYFAPMLAAKYKGETLKFPILVTTKVDGVRAIKVNGNLVSRSLKKIPNILIRNVLEELLPDGADGELFVEPNFQKTVSVVMSVDTDITDLSLTFYWFDWLYPDKNTPYFARIHAMHSYAMVHFDDNNIDNNNLPIKIILLMPKQINDANQLTTYEQRVLDEGYEGVVIRAPKGKYKYGRSTIREGFMIKLKRFEDFEATIVDTEEMMHNFNEETRDNFNRIKRSSAKDKKVNSGILGAIVAKTKRGAIFRIGTGFTSRQRQDMWQERDDLIGKLVKYRNAGNSNNGIPKCAVFLGIRHMEDL